jgi:Na+/melibiose symporter-like transporter
MRQDKKIYQDPKLFTEKVALKEKMIFASADLYGGGAPSLVNTLYFAFLVAMGVGTVWAGVIVAVAKIWDAVTDPFMGVISDNTRSKWGRRRPYILFGGMLIIASFALLFLPMQSVSSKALKVTVYMAAYLFYNTLSTVINVSYSSFSTELANNPKETTQVNTLRLIFSMCSGGIAAIGGTLLLDKLLTGAISINTLYFIVVFGFGALYTVPCVLTGLFTKERVRLPETKSTFTFKTFITPLKVKAFIYLLCGYLFAYVCMDLLSTNIVYFANYALDVEVGGTVILGTVMVITFFTLPLYYLMMQKGVAKPFIFRVGIPVYIIGIVLLTMVPLNNLPLVLFFCFLIGIGMAGSQLMPWIIFPDIIDIAELKLGDRPTGSFSGVMTFTKKSTSAIAILLSGIVLKLVGFNEPKADPTTGKINYEDFVQTDIAVWGIKLLIMVSVVIFMGLAFFAMRRLKLNNAISEKVRYLIEKRNRGEEYDEQDKKDFAQIEKDFF